MGAIPRTTPIMIHYTRRYTKRQDDERKTPGKYRYETFFSVGGESLMEEKSGTSRRMSHRKSEMRC